MKKEITKTKCGICGKEIIVFWFFNSKIRSWQVSKTIPITAYYDEHGYGWVCSEGCRSTKPTITE